jgi:hypothetical protein
MYSVAVGDGIKISPPFQDFTRLVCCSVLELVPGQLQAGPVYGRLSILANISRRYMGDIFV